MDKQILCLLSEDLIGKIDSFINNIIEKEISIQTVLYIKNEQRIEIDDFMFEPQDEYSTVKIIELGSFEPIDYDKYHEFMCEATDEVEYNKKFESTSWKNKNVSEKIVNICIASLETRENKIVELFLKDIDGNLKLKEQKFYSIASKRKVKQKKIIDISLEIYENIDFSEILLTEISAIIKKYLYYISDVMERLKEKKFYDVYKRGCMELGIEVDYVIETISTVDKDIANKLNKIFKKQYTLEHVKPHKIKSNNIEKRINRLRKTIRNLLENEVIVTTKSTSSFIKEAKKCILQYLSCKKYQDTQYESPFKFYSKYIENALPELIEKISMIETYVYTQYKNNNNDVPSIEELITYEGCYNELALTDVISLIENSYVKEKTKFKISNLIPLNPKDEYPKAREMRRKFIIHTGYTNTGKTHSSIERLKGAESGAYLAPLRLLALEVQEKLNKSGIPCSLLTGEEEDVVRYASHVSSTVEKVDIDSYYEVCVIDECQMIGDERRGFAWSRAILGVLSKEIHLCTAPEGLDILIKIIEDCNDEYEVVNHERDTKLIFLNEEFDLKKDVRKGDALIVFSKKNVLAVAADLLNDNVKASIIYGSLPYSTRKEQFQRFLNGKTDVIVSTDAIGMGLNLPIKRVIFLEIRKFDGERLRNLKPSEIRQISGRAGRKGMYDKGYVMAMTDRKKIQKGLMSKIVPIKEAYIGFSDALLNIDNELSDVIKVWKEMDTSSIYRKTDTKRYIKLIQKLKDINVKISNEILLKMISIPFEENRLRVLKLWLEYCSMHTKNTINLRKPTYLGEELHELEDYYKCLDLYYCFGEIFKLHIDLRWLKREKLKIADKINDILFNKVSIRGRICNKCKTKLKWDYPYAMCNKCYSQVPKKHSYNYRGRKINSVDLHISLKDFFI